MQATSYAKGNTSVHVEKTVTPTTVIEKKTSVTPMTEKTVEVTTHTRDGAVLADREFVQTRESEVVRVDGGRTIEVKEKDAVVQEVIHTVQVEEIQPVVHRQINKTEVHEVTQPIYEENVLPTREARGELAAITHSTVNKNTLAIEQEEWERSSREVAAMQKETVIRPTLVEEVINTNVVEIVQPVIHRDTHERLVIHETQPIYEKINEQATIIHEVRAPIVRSATHTHTETHVTSMASDHAHLAGNRTVVYEAPKEAFVNTHSRVALENDLRDMHLHDATKVTTTVTKTVVDNDDERIITKRTEQSRVL